MCLYLVEYKSQRIMELADQFGVNPNSIQNWRGLNKKYKNGHPIPLCVLDKILELINSRYGARHREIVKTIKYLQCGRTAKKVKAVIYLDENLAKLCGAHAADGSLSGLKNRGPISAKWDLGDLEKSNVDAIRSLIENIFGIKLPKLYKGKMSYTWSNMQIITRYLTRIFDFPIGNKTNIVKEPKIFYQEDSRLLTPLTKNMSIKLRFEFAKEVINFDGHSTITGGIPSIGLGCNSPQLRKSVSEIFFNYGIVFKNYENHKKILTTKKFYAKRILNLGVFRGNKRKKLKKLLGS